MSYYACVQICKVIHDASTVLMTITMTEGDNEDNHDGDDNEDEDDGDDDDDDDDDDGYGEILIYKAPKRIIICTQNTEYIFLVNLWYRFGINM